ncbi:intracellular hyaluronan-binding protein 4-like [Trematomus bernacchii]|uniref:intracellular hyaluronan-binding protein 4-like n=1 Tax=Trematomus bernacchii TaxID=40690 RepID=UPI00146F2B3E|nr:intracellular hyaluronan-binding protein 4-like [Trematomus bernacchii]
MLPDAFGCAVANRYGDLLDDDADPFDSITKAEIEKANKKKKDNEEKKAKPKKPGQKESQKDRRVSVAPEGPDPAPVRKQPLQQQQQPPQQGRPGPVTESGYGRGESQRNTKRPAFGERRANQDEYPQDFSIPKPYYNTESDQGGFRGRREGRGGGGGGGGYARISENFNPRGKRGYDRHSGTGISPEEKRGGRGPWNWGSAEENTGELMEVTPDALNKSEDKIPAEDDDQYRAEEDGEMVVHVAVEMTLDEWKALQATSRPKADFNIRKAEDQIPTKAKVIHKSKKVEIIKEGILEEVEDDSHFLRRSMNDITSLLDINFGSLGRPSRGGRGRGARGGPATRPERAKPVFEREEDSAPNPDDPEDFPALCAGK